jgi:hypothetical protein
MERISGARSKHDGGGGSMNTSDAYETVLACMRRFFFFDVAKCVTHPKQFLRSVKESPSPSLLKYDESERFKSKFLKFIS